MVSKAKKYRNWIMAAVIVIIIVASGVWYLSTNHAPSFGTVSAQRGNVIATLDESATTLTEADAALSFQVPGEITALNVQEGNAVSAGMVLASLDTSALQAALDQSNAAVASAQAKLDSLKNGTRPEELAIDKTSVDAASTALGVAVGNAYASAADAVQNQTDPLFTNPNTSNPVFNISYSDSQAVNNIENERVDIGGELQSWYGAMGDSAENTSIAATELGVLQKISSYINAIALAVNSAQPNSALSASTLTGYRTVVAAARAEVNASITSVTGAQASLLAAQNALALAAAGATSEDIEAQEAAVLEAQAAGTSAKVALDHAELVAPFAGTVENLTAKIGQVVSPGEAVLTLVNSSKIKVQTYVSEADVAKIKLGDAALITLDAFGTGTKFPAKITNIATLETEVNGAPAYEVTLHFNNPDSRIKDGMTGNAHIITGEDDNVVTVPSRLVVNNGNGQFVLVERDGETVQQPVTVGLTGDDGNTEVVSGISAGDTLVNF